MDGIDTRLAVDAEWYVRGPPEGSLQDRPRLGSRNVVDPRGDPSGDGRDSAIVADGHERPPIDRQQGDEAVESGAVGVDGPSEEAIRRLQDPLAGLFSGTGGHRHRLHRV